MWQRGELQAWIKIQWLGRRIFLWHLFDSEAVAELTGHKGEVTALRFFSQGKYLMSGGDDCTIRLWDTSTFKCLGCQWLGSPIRGFCRYIKIICLLQYWKTKL